MGTEQLSVVIIGVIAANAIVLLWVIAKVSAVTKRAKKRVASQPTTPEPIIGQAERDALKASLTQKADSETDVLLESLHKDLQGFSRALQSTLLTDATTALERQLATPEHTVAEFNKSLSATLDDINKKLVQTGEASQAQLQAEIAQHKQLLVQQFEKQMASVITTYLITALGEAAANTDQAVLVVQQLEQHKDDLRKDLLHEA